MPKRHRELPRNVEIAALLRWTIPKLADAVSKPMLADPNVLTVLGHPTGDFIRLWNQRFDRSHLFAALRNLANGREVSLVSSDGKIQVEEARLDDDGSGLLRIGREVARFVNVMVLSENTEVRQEAFTRIVSTGEISKSAEATWRIRLEERPPNGDLLLELENEIGSSPEAKFREMVDAIVDGTATFDQLIPHDVDHYARLLGLDPPPKTLKQFRRAWLANARKLDATRLVRLLKLSGPLAALPGGLLGQASDRLFRQRRLDVVQFLQTCADPFSVLAAFEISSRHRSEPGMDEIASRLLARLLDRADRLIDPQATTLAAAICLTTAFAARERTLSAWPIYAQRLIRVVHGSHILRVFEGANVDPAPLNEEVFRTVAPQARLAELCECHYAPHYEAHHFGAGLVHAMIMSGLLSALSQIDEVDRPPEWVSSCVATMEADGPEMWGLFYFAPAPLDEFETDWAGWKELPDENAEEVSQSLEAGIEPERITSDLTKLSIAFDVPPEQRDRLSKAIRAHLKRLEGNALLHAAEIGLRLAVRWRDVPLSDDIIDLLVEKAREPGLTNVGATPRLVLQAAAVAKDRDEWIGRTADIAQRFAYVQKAGWPSINLIRAIDVLRDFDPTLGQRLAQAKSIANLSIDRLPKRLSGDDGESGEKNPNDADASQ